MPQSPVSVLDFAGCDPTGATPSDAAFNAAIRAGDAIIVPHGTYRLSVSATWPKGKHWTVVPGAHLALDDKVTITIRGPFAAGFSRIFFGLGKVFGLRFVRPEWWGAVGDGNANDQPALQSAHDCVEQSFDSDGDRPTIALGAATYNILNTWTVRPSSTCNLKIVGCGTIFRGSRIQVPYAFKDAVAMLVDGQQAKTIAPITDFDFSGFHIINVGKVNVKYRRVRVGLQFGSTDPTKTLTGLLQSKVYDVCVTDFSYGIQIMNLRLIHFERCAVWNQKKSPAHCLHITQASPGVGGLVGDLTFNNCQFVARNIAINSCVTLDSNGARSATGGITGIRFTECIFYHGFRGTEILASNGSSVSDIWFSKCQWDGPQGTCVLMSTSDEASGIIDIHIKDCYFQGAERGIRLESNAQNQISNILIENNRANGTDGPVVDAYQCQNVIVSGNIFRDVNTPMSAIISMYSINNFVCTGNNMSRSAWAECLHAISVDGTADYTVIMGNSSGGCATAEQVNVTVSGEHIVNENNI